MAPPVSRWAAFGRGERDDRRARRIPAGSSWRTRTLRSNGIRGGVALIPAIIILIAVLTGVRGPSIGASARSDGSVGVVSEQGGVGVVAVGAGEQGAAASSSSATGAVA